MISEPSISTSFFEMLIKQKYWVSVQSFHNKAANFKPEPLIQDFDLILNAGLSCDLRASNTSVLLSSEKLWRKKLVINQCKIFNLLIIVNYYNVFLPLQNGSRVVIWFHVLTNFLLKQEVGMTMCAQVRD